MATESPAPNAASATTTSVRGADDGSDASEGCPAGLLWSTIATINSSEDDVAASTIPMATRRPLSREKSSPARRLLVRDMELSRPGLEREPDLRHLRPGHRPFLLCVRWQRGDRTRDSLRLGPPQAPRRLGGGWTCIGTDATVPTDAGPTLPLVVKYASGTSSDQVCLMEAMGTFVYDSGNNEGRRPSTRWATSARRAITARTCRWRRTRAKPCPSPPAWRPSKTCRRRRACRGRSIFTSTPPIQPPPAIIASRTTRARIPLPAAGRCPRWEATATPTTSPSRPARPSLRRKAKAWRLPANAATFDNLPQDPRQRAGVHGLRAVHRYAHRRIRQRRR